MFVDERPQRPLPPQQMGPRMISIPHAEHARLQSARRALEAILLEVPTVDHPERRITHTTFLEAERALLIVPEHRVGAPKLTPREMDVLALVAEGATNRRISKKLGISEHTVKFHVNALLAKFQVFTRSAVIAQAFRLGMIT